MVEIDDHCTLGKMSSLQGHSLEEGIFKSDRIEIGHDCSVGCHAFIHYGVKMGDNVTVSPDSFLMKGERPPAGSRWQVFVFAKPGLAATLGPVKGITALPQKRSFSLPLLPAWQKDFAQPIPLICRELLTLCGNGRLCIGLRTEASNPGC